MPSGRLPAHPAGLPRAQAHAWARLPSLAALGREREADAALATATRELEADAHGWAPGRFGYDAAEHALHEADAHRALRRTERATACAEQSLSTATPGTPAWAAASLLMAQTEATTAPTDAAQRADHVLTRILATRLRSPRAPASRKPPRPLPELTPPVSPTCASAYAHCHRPSTLTAGP